MSRKELLRDMRKKTLDSRGQHITESEPLLNGESSNGSRRDGEVKGRNWIVSDLIGIKDMMVEQWYINIFLLVLPPAILSEYLEWSKPIIFVLNFIAIIPLANLLGSATEELALRTGETVGGLLNATFGNAVELILSIAALQKGLINVVQGSLLGSILSNLLLVLGMSFFFGGIKNPPEQSFNLTGAGTFASLLLVSCIGLCVPALFHNVLPGAQQKLLYPDDEIMLSRVVAIILGFVYIMYLVFQLKTHSDFFESEEDEEDDVVPILSPAGATVMLIVVTLIVAVCSEALTGSIEVMSGFMSEAFIGVILLPLVGNAAEHLTAVTVAMKNKMDLAIGVAVGSSTQIALFVIPVITLAGWVIDQPMDLNFRIFDTGLLVLTVLIVNLTLMDGKSNWLEGIMLISTYVIIAFACWFNPERNTPPESTMHMEL
ncbi:hypothetical protein SARC_09533 [Sphaeroforma arctica JP610]|uniref:Sodium/calcium exchanger membrane region domain-containing protein n=1 Tax=Sphaeroforma arctica JP610 TaxID=667725 RepID=A0A0L0FMP1_9EUKA|nr:hypothetical protein SARC_09533 [Sphaeroforma arctica JP610]KNC78022.1 hypothetical protein SARC_09533 [Sphaeroforma arctica JP610]|eukprot:XP_014151924.1 hypothetical protein SARC_09533 [Sphaeroforma arctica JP610]